MLSGGSPLSRTTSQGLLPGQQSYAKQWTESDFQRFYEAVELFKDSQLSNKKIAKYMGNHIDPVRIRLEKIKYFKEKRREEREKQLLKASRH